MIKKRIFILFFFLFGCGYQPIYNLENKNYSITNFELSGNKEINRILKKNFDKYKDINKKNNKFEIKANSEKIQSTNSKSQSGTNTNLTLQIIINIEILENRKILKKVSFEESTNYNSLSNKFELKQYEKILTNDITNKILTRIHLNLSTIQ